MCVFSPRLTGLDTQIVNKKEHQADDTCMDWKIIQIKGMHKILELDYDNREKVI